MSTTRLSRDGLDAARDFLCSAARPLERSLCLYHFEGGPRGDVLEELSRFANDDGGFGNALEPDVRTPSSSALATAIGLRILTDVESPLDHPLATAAIDWLIGAYDKATSTWRPIPQDANDHPHAPWWHDEDGSLTRVFGGFLVIPRAHVLSHLHHYRGGGEIPWLDTVTEKTVRHVETCEGLGSGGGSDLEYALHLAHTDGLPSQYRDRLSACIREAVVRRVERDPRKWGTYCVTPLRAVPRPDSFGADLIPDEVAAYLDFVRKQQSQAGTWDPAWEFQYPAEWACARDEWRGILTLSTLLSLRAFNRIES